MNKLIIRILGGVAVIGLPVVIYDIWASNLDTASCVCASIWLVLGIFESLRVAITGSFEAAA
jgi:hypothetical protein